MPATYRERWHRLPAWLRLPLTFVAVALGLGLATLCMAWSVRGSIAGSPAPPDPDRLERAQRLRDVAIDAGNPPVVHQAVDYGAGVAADWWPRGEPPVIESAVAAGTLPPVAERVGTEPIVMAGPDGIGRHGGSWYRIANGTNDLKVMRWRLSGATLARWSPQGHPIVPHIAKSITPNEDASVWTVELRAGHRWSDG
ncbi:MAG: hypothetical protein ACOCXA_09665, partial [Planctomycetota bacterium]